MSDSLLPSGRSVVERFAERVARRDEPPPLPPHYFEQPQVEERLGRAAAARLGVKNARRRRNLGRMLYLFLEHPRLTRTDLAEKLGFCITAAADLAALLISIGLLTDGWHKGRTRWYSLSRAGQDWALPIVKDETPPAQ